jgi:hypothetical protein
MEAEAMQFDVDTAIATRLSQRTRAEKDRWKKYQKEERAKLKVRREQYAINQIDLALQNLDDPGHTEKLAEGYSLLGDFKSAYEISEDPIRRAEYKQVDDASDMECHCNFKEFTAKPHDPKLASVRVTKFHHIDTYPGFSLYKCVVCGHLKKC